MEKLLLYKVRQNAEITKIASQMRIKTIEIEPSQLNQTIQSLAEGRPSLLAAPFAGNAPQESVLIFCDFQEKHFDKMLFTLRQRQITTDYKAVLTPTNKDWTVMRLLLELGHEKRGIQNAGRTQV